jgi:ADP-dependent NAD(P)H-hydrate dehydratase / NAD(P)H-hydrate epimerase
MDTKFLEGLKIVTASQTEIIEKNACRKGSSSLVFMENAGSQVALSAREFIEAHGLDRIVTLLVGKGNNGGDAYAAGLELLKQGFRVKAFHLYPLEICSSLCQEMHRRFVEGGGKVCFLNDQFLSQLLFEGVLLDGLVGTGFQGKAEGVLASVIELANRSGLPILSIDIPSGVNGNTGEVETVAIQAAQTLCLGLPKSGFFLNQGWDHVGDLVYLDFGLPSVDKESAEPIAYLLDEEKICHCFPLLKRTRHKYEAGYVLAAAGSPGMPGSALLSCYAALRSGAGIVRLFYPPGMQAELSSAPYEVIRERWDGRSMASISAQAKRAKVVLLGPGMGRTKLAEKRVKTLLSKLDMPCVIDADALFFLAENPSWKIPKGSVLTPHRGEMARLLSHEKGIGSFEQNCQAYADKKKTTVVLKGAVTWIFYPSASPLVSIKGDPGMATAGAGDVLTGMIAGLMAQGLQPRTAAALGVHLHGLSGEIAAEQLTSYCMTASDLIDYLPDAFFFGKGMA